MRTKISLLALIMFLGIISLSAEETKIEKFKVYGNCGMCEKRIETAAKSIEGVITADWDKETKMIEVSFDPSKTDLKKIQKTIAEVGHDTDLYAAKEEIYNKLPGCCHYDRPDTKVEGTK